MSEFDDYVTSLPPTHWSKYDISAVKQGWDARQDEINRLMKLQKEFAKFRDMVDRLADAMIVKPLIQEKVNTGGIEQKTIEEMQSHIHDLEIEVRDLEVNISDMAHVGESYRFQIGKLQAVIDDIYQRTNIKGAKFNLGQACVILDNINKYTKQHSTGGE